jgi:nicotinamidase-related amidase
MKIPQCSFLDALLGTFALTFGIFSFSSPLQAADVSLNPKETALILVDYQNEFAVETGKLNGIVKDEIKRLNVHGNTTELVRQARQKGVLVVFVVSEYSADYRELDMSNPGLFHRIVTRFKAFQPGTPGIQIYEPIKPGPNDKDIVLRPRAEMSGFKGTDLNYILRSKGIKSVGIAGFVTNICVEATARDGFDFGFHVYNLVDAMAAKSKEHQDFAEGNNLSYVGRNLSSKDFMAMIGPAGGAR